MLKRIPDVFDCWFESGSMPYAQQHYPFENKEQFEQNCAVAEGLDRPCGSIPSWCVQLPAACSFLLLSCLLAAWLIQAMWLFCCSPLLAGMPSSLSITPDAVSIVLPLKLPALMVW
jgi:hypothetical protein